MRMVSQVQEEAVRGSLLLVRQRGTRKDPGSSQLNCWQRPVSKENKETIGYGSIVPQRYRYVSTYSGVRLVGDFIFAGDWERFCGLPTQREYEWSWQQH
jgi:hypothetical protein